MTRWWTGARWSWYIGQKFGVRPGHAGPRGYRISMMMVAILGGIGVLGVLIGIMSIGSLGALWAGVIIFLGAFMVLLGGLMVLLIRARRYVMILPPKAPPLR